MANRILNGERRPGSIDVSEDGQSVIINEVYEFLVESDARDTTRQSIVFDTPGLPTVGLFYPSVGLVCRGKSAKRRTDNVFYWDVTCKFESGREQQQVDPEDSTDPENPTTWIPLFSIDGFENKQRVLVKDKLGKKVVNSAKQKFETPLMEIVQLPCFSGFQFENPSQTLQQIMSRNETMNLTAINSPRLGACAAKTIKCNVTSAVFGVFGNTSCWKVGYRFCYDRDTWVTELLDVGSVYLDGSGNPKPYYDETNTIRIVGNLNGSGGKRAMNLEPLTVEFENLRRLEFRSFIRGLT